MAIGLVAALALSAAPGAAQAKRLALVIGNALYAHTDPLTNPEHDADAVAERLTALNFSVTEAKNVGISNLRITISNFKRLASDGDTILIYYAGHGMEMGGHDYLLPVDADLRIPSDVDDQGYRLDALFFEGLQNANVIIMFDACRDNAFLGQLGAKMAGSSTPSVPFGDIVVFSATGGQVARDDDPSNPGVESKNSLFANAVLNVLSMPNTNETDLIRDVITQVQQHSKGQQLPQTVGTLHQTVVLNQSFAGGSGLAVAAPQAAPPAPAYAPAPVPTQYASAEPTRSITPPPTPAPAPVYAAPTSSAPAPYVSPAPSPPPQSAPQYVAPAPAPAPPPAASDSMGQIPATDLLGPPPARAAATVPPPQPAPAVVEAAPAPPPAPAPVEMASNTPSPRPDVGQVSGEGEHVVAPVINDTPVDQMLMSVPRADRNPAGGLFSIAALGDKVLPRRPNLQPIPDLAIPAKWCSQKQRDDFHNQLYVPARSIAYANNEAAGQYITNLDGLRREYEIGGSGFYVVVVKESQDYKHIADQAFAVSEQYRRLFDTIMDTPIASCK